MIKLYAPKFWAERNIYSTLLAPFTFLYQIIFFIKKKLTISKKFKIPIICVGNIYLGGTGKTPLSIELFKELKKINKKPVIIKKYYEIQKDERKLIRENNNFLITEKKRTHAISKAQSKGYRIAILDDGFQDFSFQKNINILCFNSKQLIGNGLIFPSGPLREEFKAIKRAQIIVINGNRNIFFEKSITDISKKIKIYYSKYLALNTNKFKNKNLFAIAGIGNPNNFFDLLKKNNLKVKKSLAFPDHYKFNKLELQEIVEYAKKNKLHLITTEKDYYRIKDFGINISYLKIKLIIEQKSKFIKQIINYL